MQHIIKEFDTFQILLKEDIDNSDYQYLCMLYQPIIGINPTNLYLTLVQEKHLTSRINLDFNHKRLMLLLNLNQVELALAFKKLEVYQLLISYYYPSKSSYIYHLKKPLSADKFFDNEQLKTNLINKIGDLQFERQKYYFTKYQPEITNNFINITETNINDSVSKIDEKIETLNETNKLKFQQLITNLNKTQTTLNETKIPKTNPTNYQQLKANLETSKVNNTINTSTNTNNKALVNQTLALMQEKNSEEYLTTLTKKPIDSKLKNTLKLLTFNYQLNNEVVNCLLEYVWFKNNQRIEPNYILKIAKTFHENKINNINDALNHLKLAYQKSKKHSYSHKNEYQQDVLWTIDCVSNHDFNHDWDNDSNWKKNKNTNNDNLMSEKEITLILEEFDKY
ncbi:MAG: DnaD domain protein [Spiroplasma sp.]